MSIEVKVPQLPESVTDATVVTWNKQPGDSVSRDENLVDLETDKVVLEVPAPVDGVLKEILIGDDTTVTSGEILAIIDDTASAAPSAPAASDEAQAPAASAASNAESDVKTSPAVRRMLEEHNLSADDIPASAKDGRITKTDVQAYLDKGTSKSPTPAAASKAVVPVASLGGREERRVPMTRLRKKIAERMVQSKSEAAILTSFNEVDLTEVMALRAKYKEKFVKDHGVKLGFMSFFVKAAAEALKKFPVVNASIEGTDIIYHD
ncbi:MAG: 2-oxo acid dehydrogenase subunit E2, partial [Gammaproteobacteria bacterium]|nr:2-oxo acid dehydrogenase subunit E2 [Gammaproteobacteria bacterium]NNM14880.1 dihydrolipoamide succinyltransferase [Gammaproteobacteria bacterium]